MVRPENRRISSLAEDPDLASLERITASRRFSDGSLHVMFGVGVFLVGITWLFDNVPLGAAIPAVLVPLWILMHRSVVLPRVGYAEPTTERRQSDRTSLGLTAVLGAVVFIQVIVANFGGAMDALPSSVVEIAAPGLPAALVALFALIGGVLSHQKEGTSYALTLVSVGIIGGMNGLRPGAILTISGAAILVLAGHKFARFLSNNPRSENG